MRPITKIFLLLAVALCVYVLWPRQANLKGFNPAELSKLEVESWVAEKRGKGLDGLIARYRIYTSQFNFSPIASFRIAQSQGAANEAVKKLAMKEADQTLENHALAILTEKYTMIARQAGLNYDSDALAREELAWRSLERDGGPVADIARLMEQPLAAMFGGAPEDYVDVAQDIAEARALILSPEPPADVADPVAEAKSLTLDACNLLKELADTAPPADEQGEE